MRLLMRDNSKVGKLQSQNELLLCFKTFSSVARVRELSF